MLQEYPKVCSTVVLYHVVYLLYVRCWIKELYLFTSHAEILFVKISKEPKEYQQTLSDIWDKCDVQVGRQAH